MLQLNQTIITHQESFSYYPPSVSSISPTSGYGVLQLNIIGSEFGMTQSNVIITLRSTGLVDSPCNNPSWQSSTRLFCTTPVLAAGNYIVLTTVHGQTSTQQVLLEIVAAPPPTAYGMVTLGEQATPQKSILIALNYTSVAVTPNFYIDSMPKNGTLFQFSSGVVGTEIKEAGTPLVSSSLFYLPNKYFSGNDTFGYYVNDGSRSNVANIVISIAFVNQAPSFVQETFVLALNESFSSYNLDLLPLIFDPDEKTNYTFYFLSLPTRGTWTLGGKQAFTENSTLLQVGKSNPLELTLDKKGGINPYFKFTAVANDSYGLVSTNQIEVSGFVTCNSTNALNTWGTGPICVPCPVGAVNLFLTLDMVQNLLT